MYECQECKHCDLSIMSEPCHSCVPQAVGEGVEGGGVLNTKIQFASLSDAAKAGEIIQKLFGVKL